MIEQHSVKNEIENILAKIQNVEPENGIYRKIFSLIDYTTLSITDHENIVKDLVEKVNNFPSTYDMNVAGICVFPNFVETVKNNLKDHEVKIVSVSASFPFAQTFDEVKWLETEMAVAKGAGEIDIVLPLGTLIKGDETTVVQSIKEIKQKCGKAHLKIILETVLLGSLEMVRKAAKLAIEGGADFIKTSTGKNGSVAGLEEFYVMCLVVKEVFENTGKIIGIKAAGGISAVMEAYKYYFIVENVLGEKWLDKKYFRIGASSLIADLTQTMNI